VNQLPRDLEVSGVVRHGLSAWRWAIIVVSLAQIAVGVACWWYAPDGEIGRFGLAACLAVGVLGLIGQGTAFLRPAAVAANAILAAVFVPGFLGRVVIRVMLCVDPSSLPPGIYTGFDADLFAAGMVFGAAASAVGLWRLSARLGGHSADRPQNPADRNHR
jgi:hypothetical protein